MRYIRSKMFKYTENLFTKVNPYNNLKNYTNSDEADTGIEKRSGATTKLLK